MSPRRFPWTVLLPILILSACEAGMDSGGEETDIPDTVSTNFRQVSVSPEGRVEVVAATVETFDEADMTVFHKAGMKENRPDGELSLEGGADRIEVHGSGDGSASGGISIVDHSGDSRLEAEELDWNSSDRLLSGTGKVTISTGNGLTVSGSGFVADMARERYTFSDGVEGTLELEDED